MAVPDVPASTRVGGVCCVCRDIDPWDNEKEMEGLTADKAPR